jgi:hypothetical protein
MAMFPSGRHPTHDRNCPRHPGVKLSMIPLGDPMTRIERWYFHDSLCDRDECCAYVNSHLDDLDDPGLEEVV